VAATVSAPDALHRTDADALNLGHGGGGPVRRLARWTARRGDDARRNLLRAVGCATAAFSRSKPAT
jgi:hypothetical protein